MFDLDPTKILIILVIALLVIDPKRLPQLSRQIGRGVRQFRLAAHNLTREVGAEEIVEDLRGLHQARGTFGQTIRKELGLDELAQSMNLDEHDEAAADPSVVPETVGASPATVATTVAAAPKPVRKRASRAKASEAADVVPPTATPSEAAPAKPKPVRKRPPKAKPEATEAVPTSAASATSAAAPKPRRTRTRTAKTELSEPA
jgi:sec-independent protein translocase protein TatB